MYSPFDFERMPTVDAANLVTGDRIPVGPVKRPRPAVKRPADSVPVKIVLGNELKPLATASTQCQRAARRWSLPCGGAACGRLPRIRRHYPTLR